MIKAMTPIAEKAREIFEKRIKDWLDRNQEAMPFSDVLFEYADIEGYRVDVDGTKATVWAKSKIEFIAGAGELIRQIVKAICKGEKLPERFTVTNRPKYPHRNHYMPGHFGNAYEVCWPSEMEYLLEDLALFGANGYADWFDPNDMPDPYNPHVYCSSSMSLWRKKKEFLRYAKELGMETKLYVAHNVAFTDQLLPGLVGVRSHAHKVQGQVLCPSNPEARAVCLKNVENLMKDFIASHVHIDRIVCGPYDDGGCACDKCQPYYNTFLNMVYDIFQIVIKYFPDIKVDICGWWTSDDDIHLLKNFAEKISGHFGEFMYSVTYGVFEVPVDIKKRIDPLPLNTFVHIGFSHVNKDTYLKTGIHCAQERIRSVIRSFEKAGCTGFNTYNESFGDHYNEYIISRLARDPDADLDELTLEYIYDMFSLKGENSKTLLKIMNEMQFYDLEKAVQWEKDLTDLQEHVSVNEEQSTWLFEQIMLKAQLMALDYKIGDYTLWKEKSDLDAVLPLIEKREKLFGKMYRYVYGLGLMRHIFIPERMEAPWYEAYRKFYPVPQGNIIPGMQVNKNA
jgi:hypothetical protein